MAPSRAKFVDADQFLLYFSGVQIQGFADGEYAVIEQMTEAFTEVVGTDGEVARSKTNDRRVKVTLKLLQTSAANAQLSAIHQRDLNSPNGAGVGTFSMVDLFGGSLCEGDQAWIVKYPDSSLDRSAKSRDWEIHVANGNRLENGN